MKSTVLTLGLMVAVSFGAAAQKEELKKASEKIDAKDYVSALAEIGIAKNKVSDLINDQLASVLPTKFGEMEIADSDGFGMGGGVSVNKVYRKPKAEQPEGQSEREESPDEMPDEIEMGMMGSGPILRVEITTNMAMASDVQMAHSMSDEEGMGDPNLKALRIKGYRAAVRNMNDMGGPSSQGVNEEAKAIVGGALITVSGNNLEKEGQAQELIGKIDLEKLIQLVGK